MTDRPSRACVFCDHYQPRSDILKGAGQCRRNPPAEGYVSGAEAVPSWPLVMADHWCGEFRERWHSATDPGDDGDSVPAGLMAAAGVDPAGTECKPFEDVRFKP